MKILVTGANGFIGTHICNVLSTKHQLFALTRSGNHHNPAVTALGVDLSKEFDATVLPKQIDVVIHLAQSRKFREFPNGVVDTLSVNTLSTARLLNYAIDAQCQQFIFASTGSVYTPGEGLLSELDNINPSNPYAISKYATELIANCYAKQMQVLNLRIFFPYGPGQEKMFIPNLINSIKEGNPVTISGDSYGLAFCPLYIADLCRLIADSIDHKASGTLNLGGAERVTLVEAANAIADHMGLNADIQYNPDGKPVSFLSDNSVIEAALNTKVSNTPFAEGIKTTIDSIFR